MRVSLHWGPVDALEAARAGVDVVVVVDVLSFTTTLSVALDRGAEVLPHERRDDSAAELAAEHGAVLAVARDEPGTSLSPASVRAAPGLVRLVLPSPNGSATSRRLAPTGVTVVGGCLRNASAVGAWVAARSPGSVAVVAAGERWPDGSLRPALEDLLGAGAVLAALGGERTPDAAAAVAAYVDARGELATRLRDCPSGRELIGRGFAEDVEIAAELDASAVVPVLRDGVFRDDAG